MVWLFLSLVWMENSILFIALRCIFLTRINNYVWYLAIQFCSSMKGLCLSPTFLWLFGICLWIHRNSSCILCLNPLSFICIANFIFHFLLLQPVSLSFGSCHFFYFISFCPSGYVTKAVWTTVKVITAILQFASFGYLPKIK